MGELSFSQLGKYGQLGNQLFQMASTIGIAHANGMDVAFPEWPYSKYFNKELTKYISQEPLSFDYGVKEPAFHYQSLVLDRCKHIDLIGYFQSEKYFLDIKYYIRDLFTWCPTYQKEIYDKHAHLFEKPTVAIHIRRGDYVDNPNYYPIDYPVYIKNCLALIPKDVNVLVFSNDLTYAKSIGKKEWNYITGSETDDLCLGSMCDFVIMSNSSFSWWMAWIHEEKQSKMVFRPRFWNDGNLLQHSDDKDVCPERWITVDDKPINVPTKIDLTDVTFCIPIKIDCEDRKENVELSLKYLRENFKTKILIYEQSVEPEAEYLATKYRTGYKHIPIKDTFERTLLLNLMAHASPTPYVVNWDCDVFVDPQQIFRSVQALREDKVDGIYPYDGRFLRVNRSWYKRFKHDTDVSIFKNIEFTDAEQNTVSLGGAIIWNKEKFIQGGMENQFFVHYGPEDVERYERFTKLGFRIGRAKGPLYHINHSIIYNGATGHDYLKSNNYELTKIQHMSKSELEAYISSWPWKNKPWGLFEKPVVEESSLNLLGFDKCYVVNLERRKDRRASTAEVLKYIGFHNYSFFPAVDGQALNLKHDNPTITPGMMGCFLTHKDIFKEALDKGYRSILVLEDDIVCIDDFERRIKESLDTLPEDWQFIHLGHSEYDDQSFPWKENYLSRVNDNWVVPNAVWGTHAYAIRGAEFIKEMYQVLSTMENQVDVQMYTYLRNNRHIKNYAVYPSLFYQDYKKHGTDIQLPQIQEI